MTIFDLLFLLLALTVLISLGRAGMAAVRHNRPRATRILRRLGTALALYFAVLLVVSLVTPQARVALGEAQCSDDWCVTVTDAHRAGDRFEVDFALSSRAGRISQRERFVVAYLVSADGRRYDAEPAGTEPPFDTLLGPLESVTTRRWYVLPDGVRPEGVIVAREGGFNFPGCCIIGENQSFLHRMRLVPVSAD